jgi:hypothetical protein
MRRLAAVLLSFSLVSLLAAGCRETPKPVDTGNATDRSADGTTGTGEPRTPAADSSAAATSLDTIGNSRAATSTNPAMTGTEDVRAGSTATTGTLATPSTTTISVATPTDTSTTVAKKP